MADDDHEKPVADNTNGEKIKDLPEVSGITFDEMTVTLTLKLASEEEITEVERQKNERKIDNVQ